MTRDKLKEAVAPLLGLLAVALVCAVLGYLTANTRGAKAPGAPAPQPEASLVQGTLSAQTSDSITVMSDSGTSRTYKLSSDLKREQLRAATFAEIRIGDWLNGGAISHAQSVYSLTGFVLIPKELLAAPK